MSTLDHYVSREIRSLIEERYYGRINELARFENLVNDPSFIEAGDGHPGFFSDHGTVHMRDVAGQMLEVLDNIHGVLIPRRSRLRFHWMKGYGVLLAYLHDIGMVDFSEYGRSMHPEAAAQAVYSPELEDIFEAIWQENSGQVAWRLLSLADEGFLLQPPKIVLRELLTLTLCHSKSKAPVQSLNQPPALRRLLIEAVSTDMNTLYGIQQLKKLRLALARAQESGADPAETDRRQDALEQMDKLREEYQGTTGPGRDAPESGALGGEGRQNPDFFRHYDNAADEAFSWLTATEPAGRALVQDAIDTVRILRCADALRQRGTVLKTSGNYEVFVDQCSANAIYAFRGGDDQLFLFERPSWISSGEANLAGSELEPTGHLRIAFHRGHFSNIGATEYAAKSAAIVICGMQEDILESFERPVPEHGAPVVREPHVNEPADMCILLEETDDNPHFAALVIEQLHAIMPYMIGRIMIVPSLALATPAERRLYLAAEPFDWDEKRRHELLARIAASGHLVEKMDARSAFEHVKVVHLNAEETLIEAGAPAGFVYIPLGAGLDIVPLGGYLSFSVRPWMPLGATGVIRGATRNASVIARCDLQLLMIPKSVYLRQWHRTYSPEAFGRLVQEQREER